MSTEILTAEQLSALTGSRTFWYTAPGGPSLELMSPQVRCHDIDTNWVTNTGQRAGGAQRVARPNHIDQTTDNSRQIHFISNMSGGDPDSL